MELLDRALEFEENVSTFKSRDERIKASHTAKYYLSMFVYASPPL